MNARHQALVAIFATIGWHRAPAQRLAKPVIDTINHHIVRVVNSGPSAWADTNGWKLVYERTVQPPEGSPGMLEKPSGLLLLPDGRVLVSQRTPATIRLYDVRGNFVRNVGREGGGPGEYRTPRIAIYHDTLVAYDAPNGRATLLTLDGKFLRTFLTGIHADGPPIMLDDHGRLKIEKGRAGPGFHQEWVYFDLTGKFLDSIAAPESTPMKSWDVKVPGGSMSQAVPFAPYTVYAFYGDGSYLFGASDRYEFTVMRSAHDTARIFGRPKVSGDPIPSALRDSMFEQVAKDPQLRSVASESDMPKVYSVVSDLSIDGLGNVWVYSGHDAKVKTPFDVFSPSGSYLGRVASPFGRIGRLASWSGNRVALVDADENDLPRIRIYRIDRRGH